MLRGVVEQQGSTMFPQPVNLLINFKSSQKSMSSNQIKLKCPFSSPLPVVEHEKRSSCSKIQFSF